MSISRKRNQQLWEKIKKQVMKGNKGGNKGQWSARKAQLAVRQYKEKKGTYIGKKSANNSLKKWSEQDWQYAGKKKESRYLPKKAIAALSSQEKSATNKAKKQGTKKGKQFVRQPKNIAKKTAKYRK